MIIWLVFQCPIRSEKMFVSSEEKSHYTPPPPPGRGGGLGLAWGDGGPGSKGGRNTCGRERPGEAASPESGHWSPHQPFSSTGVWTTHLLNPHDDTAPFCFFLKGDKTGSEKATV